MDFDLTAVKARVDSGHPQRGDLGAAVHEIFRLRGVLSGLLSRERMVVDEAMLIDEALNAGDLPERFGREGDTQPMPTVNDHDGIHDQLMVDIEGRRQLGIKRYGNELQPFNGRSSLLDCYEELLDAAIYFKQLLIEKGVSS